MITEALYRNSNAERNVKSPCTEKSLGSSNGIGEYETMKRVLSHRCVFSSLSVWLEDGGQMEGLQTSRSFAARECEIMWYGYEQALKWERMAQSQVEELGNITASSRVRKNVDSCQLYVASMCTYMEMC